MLKILFISFLLFSFSFVYAQSKCDQVLLTGRVEDSLNPQSFYNLMIVNRTRGNGVFGQPNGHFSVYMNDRDSISISVKGYPMIGFRIHADENCQFKYHKFIELKATEIKEVVIKPLKTLNQIKEERQELSMRETRQVTGIEKLQSPITALYQTFSKREKNKKWIAEQEFKDNERKVVQELLRLYVAYDIINLTEDEFDDFIIFLNINETFLKTATEMELITFVQDKFEHFKRLNSIAVEENYVWKSELEKNNKKQAMIDLLKLFVGHELINLPEVEFDRFTEFMKMEDSFLKVATETELINFVQDKYAKYIAFYKLNFDTLKVDYHITNVDNYKWKSDLSCNKKEAVSEFLKMYIEHHVIDLETSELERFTRFLNLDESFMKSSSDSELIYFVQEKYKKYLQFYKIK
jgi:hypothetical protein